MKVRDDVQSAMKQFHQEKKYIGVVCIAPMVAAKVFGTQNGGPGVKLTLGCKTDIWPNRATIGIAESFGNQMEDTDVFEVCHDVENKIVSGPAYMKSTAKSDTVYESIKKVIDEASVHIRKEQNQQYQKVCEMTTMIVKKGKMESLVNDLRSSVD